MSTGAELVDVTFIDADSGQTFLQLKVPARQLPASFVEPTSLNLGKDDWQVIDADPPTAEAFVKQGALRLRLRRLQAIDVRDILFSLPTVADEVPKEVPRGGRTVGLSLHEDDWLQREWVPAGEAAALEPQLAEVRKVLNEERAGQGFKRLFIRKGRAVRFGQAPLSLTELQARFGPPSAVAWHGRDAVLEGAFVFAVPRGFLYGSATADGRVEALAEHGQAPQLSDFVKAQGLVRVDWCAARVDPG